MINKIRVAFIYKDDNIFLSGKHFDNCYYHFFINALKRNKRLDIKNFPTKSEFDASILRNKFDIILLWSNADWGMPNEIKGIQDNSEGIRGRPFDTKLNKCFLCISEFLEF
mgnify:CR=1 FL=1